MNTKILAPEVNLGRAMEFSPNANKWQINPFLNRDRLMNDQRFDLKETWGKFGGK